MSGQEVVEVIDTLCEKVGIAVSDLWGLMPGLSRYEIISDIIGIVFTLLYVTCVVAFICIQVHRHRRYNYDPEYEPSDFSLFMPDAVCAIMGVIGVFLILTLVCCVSDIVGWVVTPETKFISWLLGLFS